jgi:hypothetical protein
MRQARWTVRVAALAALAAALPAAALDLHGFADVRAGARLDDDPHQDRVSLAELRLQLDWMRSFEHATFQVRSDFLADPVQDDAWKVDLERGEGPIDLREANLLLYPSSFSDLKIGRQILTWGTGDLLFINDLFPKDWVSFFAGRDEEYLKAPSDAAMLSLFPPWAAIDIVYTPRFDADRFLSGRRFSFWNDAAGGRTGESMPVNADVPDDWFGDEEIAVRVSRNIGSQELALYGYRGYWKSPAGRDPLTGRASFPELHVAGASARGQLGPGILNLEGGWYDSADDRDGDDPLVRNSEVRLMAGYQFEAARDLNAAFQTYLEHMLDHGEYEKSLPAGIRRADEHRVVTTLRLTRLLMNQNLILSLFVFYSPTDRDAYLRPNAQYKASDHWSLTVGGNLFYGEDPHTFFGQFEDNNNIYVGARYSY